MDAPNTTNDTSNSLRLSQISEQVDRGALNAVKQRIHALHPAEIAWTLEALPRPSRHLVWGLISDDDEGEVLVHLNDEVRADIIESMSADDLSAALADMQVDDLADVVGELPETLTQQVLHAMSTHDRERVSQMLAYDEDSAGGLMNTDVVTIRPDVSLDVVMRYLQSRSELPERTDKLFVVNRYGRFIGSIALRTLVTQPASCMVSEVMDHNTQPINAALSAQAVANRFRTHDLLSAAVVDDSGQLIGRITVDDVIDVVQEQAEHELLGRVGLDEDVDMFAPIFASSKRRALWLGINLLTAFLAASVVGLFKGTIEQVVALAVLMPVVASMGGIAGTQTLTLITRGLALGQVGSSNQMKLALKETMVGLLNGLFWALVVALITVLWFGSFWVAGVIALALVINMLVAGMCGVVIPVLLKKAGIDPALAGGVVLTTITDVVGFVTFLGLGAWLLVPRLG